MVLLYSDPRLLLHETGDHPECAQRLRQVTQLLKSTGADVTCTQPAWKAASVEQLQRVHRPGHLAGLENLAARGGGLVDRDTIVAPRSFEIAALAAGAVSDAVERVMAGDSHRALCLVRPPGHHALADRAMGFCLINHAAVGAQAAIDIGACRVLVVDWDVHHGNGTQAIFYDDSRVGYFSVHRWPFYPGTGTVEETGAGEGLGATRNLPLEFGTTRAVYRDNFVRELEDFAARIRPEIVLVSAGFDGHRADPIGSLGLEVEDFQWLTATTVQVANAYAEGRIVSTLEGGYNPPVLAECVAVHLAALQGD
ncbi:MAG: histone deacetylase [Pirellulales bacterium]|nr:histone deacetylase [Pirellulales bacterium]